MMEGALLIHRLGHRNHLGPKLTVKITVGNGIIESNQLWTRWMGVWMDAHLTFKEQHNRWKQKARVADCIL
jgi:hypothetical protein